MNHQPLPELINTCQELLGQIRQHPHFKKLDYQPDITIADASQALKELKSEVASCPDLNVSIFEEFHS
jgi:hypothetical protein